MDKLKGKKTYVAGWGMVFLGVVNLISYFVNKDMASDPMKSIEMIGVGLGFVFSRSGIADVREKLDAIEPRNKLRTPETEKQWELDYGNSRPEK